MDIYEVTARIVMDVAEYINGLNEAKAETDKFASNVEGASSKSDKLGGSVEDVARKIKAFVKNSVAVSATVKLGRWLYETADAAATLGDQIDKQSQKLGISSDAYQQWGFILEHNGASISSMTTAMRTLTAQAGKQSEAFQKIGISLTDVKSMSQEDLFAATITGLQNVGDATERAKIANELLGRSYMELNPLLNSTAADTADLVAQYDALNGKMSAVQVKQAAAYVDAKTNLDTAIAGLKNQIGMIFVPAETEAINWMADIVGNVSGMINNNGGGGNDLEEAKAKLETLRQTREELLALYDGNENMVASTDQAISKQMAYIAELEQRAADAVVAANDARVQAEAEANAEIEAYNLELAQAYAETYNQMRDAVSGFFDVFSDKAKTHRVNLNNIIKNIQSQIDWNNQYAESMSVISEYADEQGLSMEGLNAAIAAAGTAGADYAKAMADAIKAGKPEQVEAIAAAFDELQGSQDVLAGTLTDSVGAWDALAGSAIGDIDAIKSAFAGLNMPDIHNYVYTHHQDVYDSPSKSGVGGRAGGLDYVPKHNYLALLHEGERVMTKEENKRYTEGKDENVNPKGITINQFISAVPQTPAELAAATQAYFEQAYWMM